MKNKLSKTKVGILCGGVTGEHEISIQTAISIIENIDRDLFDCLVILIDKSGCWRIVPTDSLLGLKVNIGSINHLASFDENSEFRHITINLSDINYNTKISALKDLCDVIFVALHGKSGEDGKIQGFLETINMPYTGSKVLQSAICMDKYFSKQIAEKVAIPVLPYFLIKKHEWNFGTKYCVSKIEEMGFPIFVKPVDEGSSLGISKVADAQGINEAIAFAFQYSDKILVEKAAFTPRDIEIAVLEPIEDNIEPIVSMPGMIETSYEFYSYDAKYLNTKQNKLTIPAKINASDIEICKDMALLFYKTICCNSMLRVDFIMDGNGAIYFNEANTIPGFTKVSMYPSLMQTVGIEYKQLITHIIKLSLKSCN